MLQSLSFQILHHYECAAVILANVVNRAYVGMVETGSGLGLAAEAAERLLVSGDVLGKELERDEAAEAGVLRLENHSHATAAELLDNPVMRDGLSDHNRRARGNLGILGRSVREVNDVLRTCC